MSYKYSSLDYNLAEEYTSLVLGMDNMYRSQSAVSNEETFNKEGLVPINLTDIKPADIDCWNRYINKLQDIANKFCQLKNDIRKNYILQQINSTVFLAKWFQNEADEDYRCLVRNLLYVNECFVPSFYIELLHKKLNNYLVQQNYEGPLKIKVANWKNDNLVETENIKTAIDKLLREAKARTVANNIEPARNLEIGIDIVFDVPYQAYCDYMNKKIYLNADIAYTYPALKHLVAHEAFPGHATHLKIRENKIKAEEIPSDAGLIITNTASSSIFEGIGENALDFINWKNTDNDKIFDILRKLYSVAGLNAAHMIHQENKDIQEVKKYMINITFKEEKWVESRLRFIRHNFRAPFIFTYWRGEEAVKQVYSKVSNENQEEFLSYLFGNMHSADTVNQYPKII